jgi:hypothetical protein
MSVSSKRRRRLFVDGRLFLWWVFEDLEDFGRVVLAVITPTKDFHVRYVLSQTDETRHVLNLVGRARRFRSPKFGSGDRCAPGDVRALIRWCNTEMLAAEEVDWTVRTIGSRSVVPPDESSDLER